MYWGYDKGLFLPTSYIVLDYEITEKVISSLLNLHVLAQ